MKFVTLTFTRNEADIIESLCRYTCSYADHMVIFEDKSQDNTKEIITNLIKEGLPITLFDEEKLGIGGKKATAILTQLIFSVFKADWLLPIDADEFLGHVDGISPRQELEKMSPLVENHIMWRSYACNKPLDNNTVFLPHYFSVYREIGTIDSKKVAISKELYKQYSCYHRDYPHWIYYPNKEEVPVPALMPKNLIYAHYPLRSEQQALIKIIITYVNYRITQPHKVETSGVQYNKIYQSIMENGSVSMDALYEASLRYGFMELPKDISLGNGALGTDFCKEKLTLKYTKYNQNHENIIQTLSRQLFVITNDYVARVKKE